MCVCRLRCSFRSSAGSNMMDLMMRLLIISVSYGSYSSGGVDHNRHSIRALAFNEKLTSSSSHMVDMTEDVSAAEEATALHC